jgi:pyruvate kinase
MYENDLQYLLEQIDNLLNQTQLLEEQYAAELQAVHPHFKHSARNLLHYLALRDNDLREVQEKLASLGLSSLGRVEAHTQPNLLSVRQHLRRLLGSDDQTGLAEIALEFNHMNALLVSHTQTLLGELPPSHGGHILVTLAADMVNDVAQFVNLLKAGMSSVRINCAHDDEQTWLLLIKTVRQASKETGLSCKIFMDLGGPKIRTGELKPEPGFVEIKPTINTYGKLSAAARIWLVPPGTQGPDPADAVLTMPLNWLKGIEHNHKVRFTDIRGRDRTMRMEARQGDCVLLRLIKNSNIGAGIELRYTGPPNTGKIKATVGPLPGGQTPLLLFKNDMLILHGRNEPGEPARRDAAGKVIAPAHISCTLPQVLKNVHKGHRVLFNDGTIEGEVVATSADELTIQITYAKDKGSKLRSAKGINFPDSALRVSGLTAKDREDLAFVVKHADVVNMSFVNTPADVHDLFTALDALDGDKIGVLLKIETQRAFKNLPKLLLTVMQRYPAGIMIARGDMAVEVGWNRLAEVQEEMLWLCQAAHIPVVWATQVLETLAQKGRPSRSEITDAAMSQRAECVMLNKGPYIIEAVHALSDILSRMQGHQFKKTSMLRKLHVANINKDPA